jgi:hypothetical protein
MSRRNVRSGECCAGFLVMELEVEADGPGLIGGHPVQGGDVLRVVVRVGEKCLFVGSNESNYLF